MSNSLLTQIIPGLPNAAALTNNILNIDGTSPTDTSAINGLMVTLVNTATAGTISIEGSNDNVVWGTTVVQQMSSSTSSPQNSIVFTGPSTVGYIVPTPWQYLRFRITSALTGGSVNVTSVPLRDFPNFITNAVSLSGSTQSIGAISVTSSATAGLQLVSRLNSSAASVNATLIKSSAARMYKIVGFNASATPKYLKTYNKATLPVPGTDTPLLNIPLRVGDFEFSVADLGVAHSTGLGYALTGASADSDATVLAAGDIVGLNILYT